MAKKNVFVHLDLNKQELQNAKAQNLTTAQIATLAGGLGSGDKGLFVYDTTLGKLFVWSGTAFENVTPAPPEVGQYRGGVAHTAAEPASLVSGDWVVFTSAGVVTNFGGTQTVQIGDWAIYNGTTWDILQGNVDVATETTVGLVRLATNAEALAGTNAETAMTPEQTLAATNDYISKRQLLFTGAVTANVPFNIPRGTKVGDVQDVKFSYFDGNKEIPIEIEWYVEANTTIVCESNISIALIVARVIFTNAEL
jgi:hypothetical protein